MMDVSKKLIEGASGIGALLVVVKTKPSPLAYVVAALIAVITLATIHLQARLDSRDKAEAKSK